MATYQVNAPRSSPNRTSKSAELIKGLKTRRVVRVVRLEGDAKEISVWDGVLVNVLVLRAAQAVHLPIDELDVEIGELDVVALRRLQTPA